MDDNKPSSPPLPAAVYVNFLRVGSQESEFFLAFGQVGEDRSAATLLSSLVTTPTHAKAMLQALTQAVAQFETRFGPIPTPAPASPGGAKGPSAAAPPPSPTGRMQPKRKVS